MEQNTASAENSGTPLKEIFQSFSDLNVLVDEQGKVLNIKTGQFLLPQLPQPIPGKDIREVFSAGDIHKFEQTLQSVLQTGQPGAFEYKLTVADQDYWMDARLVRISPAQLLFVARDVTKCRETENRLTQQMQHLALLRSIDLAIASGLDLNLLLAMLLEQLIELMRIDAATILLQNPKTHLLEFTAGKGFRSNTLQYTHLRQGEGWAGRVALERRMLNIPNLKENDVEFGRSPLFKTEDFTAYFGVPLISKGRVLGVLEMFHRSPLRPNTDWLDFLNMVAGQAAIAIDNAVLFRDLHRSNAELNIAYDATIEGLTRALDLRDKETEEHTRRVSDLTVDFAVRLGVEHTDLIHVRRGAILHDIGKMAIPDRILFKPGPLTDDEWKIMRQHPRIAVDLLSSVLYLTPALEIPRSHHEKWDGTGYPDKLSGEAIPFPARLFALVDVYDALTSNRPYRSAWTTQETLTYIQSQSGRHFDPLLVPEFVGYMNKHPI